jgi:hypothetical protein
MEVVCPFKVIEAHARGRSVIRRTPEVLPNDFLPVEPLTQADLSFLATFALPGLLPRVALLTLRLSAAAHRTN